MAHGASCVQSVKASVKSILKHCASELGSAKVLMLLLVIYCLNANFDALPL